MKKDFIFVIDHPHPAPAVRMMIPIMQDSRVT